MNQTVADSGYFRSNPASAKLGFSAIGLGLGFASGIGFSAQPLLGAGLAVSAIIFIIVGQVMPARTEKGLQLYEYLLGLKQYMTIAEAERLKVLQSPHGELTEKIDVNDKTQLVKLYEKLLPYAMLFGIEKDWVKQFAGLYDQAPDWYSGTSAFNAAYFASSMSSFNTASTAGFTPPSSSGSGGSAGGGGGGGGGGGW